MSPKEGVDLAVAFLRVLLGMEWRSGGGGGERTGIKYEPQVVCLSSPFDFLF